MDELEAFRADRYQSGSLDRAHLDLRDLIASAEHAQDEGAARQALNLWREVRTRSPENDRGWASECALLLQFGQYDEAERTITEATRQRPDSLTIASSACVTAMMRMDWVEAAVRMARLCWDFPAHPYHESTVPGLRQTIDRSLSGIDDSLLEDQALAAEQAADPVRSAVIRQHLFSRNPALFGHALHALFALRKSGHDAVAETVCQSALAAHPDQLDLLIQGADIAARRSDWQMAATRWRAALRSHPTPSDLAVFAAPALLEAGALDEADQLLEAAIQRAPARADLRLTHALAAEHRPDARQAVIRWTAIAVAQPDDPGIRHQRGAAMLEAGLQRLQKGDWDDDAAIAEGLGGAALEHARLAQRFLALGSGCELGAAQRQLGAEPLDLLRFSNIDAADAADLIDQDFRGIGDPSAMVLSTVETGEYFVGLKDLRMVGHGFVYKHRMPAEIFFSRHVARLGLLARKLLTDLVVAERIFLHHSPGARITDEKARYLHKAMRRRGNTILLVTRTAESDHPDGSIATLGDRLYVGYFGQGYGGERVAPSVSDWRHFLQQASDAIDLGGGDGEGGRQSRSGRLPFEPIGA